MRGYHDVGGLPAGPIDQTPHEPTLAEKRIHAMVKLLGDADPPLMTDDELRRGIESLGAEDYHRLTYYERWLVSLTNNLLFKGLITTDELGRKLEAIKARGDHDSGV